MIAKKIIGKKILTFLPIIKKNRLVPMFFRSLVYHHISLLDFRTSIAVNKDPYNNDVMHSSSYQSNYPYCLGIIKEMWHNHKYFIAACRELNVSYKVIDISESNWIENILESDCDAFLVRPSVVVSVWKEMYDERIKIIHSELGKIVYPTSNELWFFENKRRMYYWLQANRFPIPETNIFYNKEKAISFAETVSLPIVFKSTISSGGRGIMVIDKRSKLINFIRRYFKKGFLPLYHEKKDREWGNILFQEYLPNAREWRIIRIGDSYFGYEKLCVDGLHSGSGKWKYMRPPDELLNLAKEITERGGFTSMDLDIFMTEDGRLLVNELQTYFGTQYKKEMCVVDNKAGRMVYNSDSNSWNFEAGSFCNNNLCNLRVKTLIKMLDNINLKG